MTPPVALECEGSSPPRANLYDGPILQTLTGYEQKPLSVLLGTVAPWGLRFDPRS